MTLKRNFFEMIEDYVLDAHNPIEREEFETELKSNPELSAEVKFERKMQAAIAEKDVLNLRKTLESIGSQTINEQTPFGLLEGFDNVQQLSEILAPEELLKFFDSLPKAHVYQHELASIENIHEFFREQNLLGMETEEEFLMEEFSELEEIEGLEDAILEKDILNLRDTLTRVSAISRHQFSVKEIDNYLNGELDGEELKRFEQELVVNGSLQQDVFLHRGIEIAMLDSQLISLRQKMTELMNIESDSLLESSSDTTVDKNGAVLDGLNKNSFSDAELNLKNNLDNSIGEFDVFALRQKLHLVKHEIQRKEIKSFISGTNTPKTQWWRASVAVAVIVFAFVGLLRVEFGSDNIYEKYYSAPEWAPQRSVSPDLGILQQANQYFVQGDYETAITFYDKAIRENKEKFVFQFYKAASLQGLEKFDEAIPEFTNVILHGDNMFIEESEWYRALCYIRLNQKEIAKEQLLAITRKNGYYASDAKAILRKNKHLPR